MLCGTGAPPALLGVLGVGDESPGKSQPSEAPEKEGEGGLAQGVQQDEAGVTSAEAATPGEGDEALGDAGAVAVDAASRDGEEGGEEEEEEEEEAEAEAAAVAVRDMPEDVLKVAKECVVYEDVSGVITAVYAARYGTDAAGKVPAVPLWVRQMASLARLAGRTDAAAAAAAAANAGGSGDGSDPHPKDGGPSTLVGGNGGAAAAAAAEGGGADAVSGAGGGTGAVGTEEGARGIDSSDGLRGGGVSSRWRTPAAGNIAARGHRRGGCSVAEGGTTVREGLRRGGGFLPVLAARSRRGRLVGRAADVARRLRGGG
ncbi:unnamed protein product [Ectocarpus sp. 8 AP-2014]